MAKLHDNMSARDKRRNQQHEMRQVCQRARLHTLTSLHTRAYARHSNAKQRGVVATDTLVLMAALQTSKDVDPYEQDRKRTAGKGGTCARCQKGTINYSWLQQKANRNVTPLCTAVSQWLLLPSPGRPGVGQDIHASAAARAAVASASAIEGPRMITCDVCGVRLVLPCLVCVWRQTLCRPCCRLSTCVPQISDKWVQSPRSLEALMLHCCTRSRLPKRAACSSTWRGPPTARRWSGSARRSSACSSWATTDGRRKTPR